MRGTEVSIADDAFDADSKGTLCQQMADFHGKEALSPFFNENGEDGWHEKEQGMDYWDYVKIMVLHNTREPVLLILTIQSVKFGLEIM